jgi:hypothetical protein
MLPPLLGGEGRGEGERQTILDSFLRAKYSRPHEPDRLQRLRPTWMLSGTMSVGRVNSIAHNFGHHFLWFREGFIYAHISSKARDSEIDSVTIDILREQITPSSLDTSVFRHVISELRSKFYSCLDSVMVSHDYVTDAEVSVEAADFPARRCRCTIRDRYGHTYSREVEIAPNETTAA